MNHEREPAAITQILDAQADVMVAMGLTTARDRAMHGIHVVHQRRGTEDGAEENCRREEDDDQVISETSGSRYQV